MSEIFEVDFNEEGKKDFLTYSSEVLLDRAVPSAEDGLLSSQRKILWTMEEYLKMNSSSKTKKCNSIIGSTLMTSYYHGDQACYGVLVKMAQPFLMRYPLIIGQGALGTQESNDMVASSRYTEAKPSQVADLMMLDYKKNTVPTKRTYNDEFDEPVVLPSLFPNALVNGKQTIAIGLAHCSNPHNLNEVCDGIVAYINNKDIDIDGLMKYIKGPDLPMGNVVDTKGLRQAFLTGKTDKGLKVRGDYYIDGNKIIFTSIPYRTYRNKIKEQINNNIDDFDKILEDFSDESNLGQNKLIFELKKGISHSLALNKIFGLTDLQSSISYNMNYIVNGTPKLCSLKDLIVAYYNHQISVLLKATEYDKDKAEKRAHILKGLILAVDKINEVIELIKKSSDKKEAKDKLKVFLNIDDIQAEAILDMKLSKLTKIDKEELVNELKEKEEIIERCIKIIKDNEYRDSILVSKIKEMKEKFGDVRRTRLESIADLTKEEKEIQYVEPEKCVVTMTEDGLIKRIPITSFRTQRRNGKGVKTPGDITKDVIRTNTIDSLMIFTNRGRMYRILVDSIPVGTNVSKGVPVQSLVQMENFEEPQLIYSIYRNTEAKYLFFTTKNGIVKKTPLEDFTKTRKKTGITSINLHENDELVSVNLINEEEMILITSGGMSIRFNSKEVSASGRSAAGIKGITLKENDYVVSALPIRNTDDKLAIFAENGLGKKVNLKELMVQKRAGKGLVVYKGAKVVDSTLISDEDSILIVGKNNSICISAKEIPEASRGATGNVMIKGNINTVSKV